MSKKAQLPAGVWGQGATRRYVLTGAALGLYFGLFFRPVREPSLLLALGLSFLAALVTAGLWAARERPRLPQLLRRLAASWGQYLLALAALEGRHLAHDWGGRPAVVALTVLAGACLGAWLAAGAGRREGATRRA